MGKKPLGKAEQRRAQIREEHWSGEAPWLGAADVGYFAGPRTLPYILLVLRQKAVSG